jgi:nucleoside-diphosphate-sugar epimerase
MILVTGGAGFIGSHLVEALLQKGHEVRVLDNLSTGKKENLAEATGSSLENFIAQTEPSGPFSLGNKAEFLLGDITSIETCRMACQGISFVFHLAALGSVPRSVEDPITSHRANATGTLHILQAAKESRVKRVVYASSSSVYGNISSRPDEKMPKGETLPPHPQSPYAATKLMGEQYCRIFSELYGLETVALRFFNVFGPRQDPQSIYAAVIPKFITALLKGISPIIYGDGQQSRDFTYVANVVQANLLAMKTAGVSGRAFNIACGRQITINSLFSSLQEISGRPIAPQYEPARSGEVRHSLASIDLAKAHLAYKVQIEFEAGLQATWNWFRQKE